MIAKYATIYFTAWEILLQTFSILVKCISNVNAIQGFKIFSFYIKYNEETLVDTICTSIYRVIKATNSLWVTFKSLK